MGLIQQALHNGPYVTVSLPRKILDVHHQVVVLGDLPGDLHNGSLLEAVCANHLARHLACDGNHGH